MSCWGEMPSTSQIWVHFPHLNYTISFRYFYMVAVSGEQRKNIHGLHKGPVGDWVELDGSRILSRGNTSYSIIVEGKKSQKMVSKVHFRLLWKKVKGRGNRKLPDPGFVDWRMERMKQRKERMPPASLCSQRPGSSLLSPQSSPGAPDTHVKQTLRSQICPRWCYCL